MSVQRQENDEHKNGKDRKFESGFESDLLMLFKALLPMFLALLGLSCLPSLLGEESGGKILEQAVKKAFRGGIPGSIAAAVQILSLMWLRTVVNYQYKTGEPFLVALNKLNKEGGIRRFYRGFVPAILLVPLSRFGDTASNAGMLAILSRTPTPVFLQTACASFASSLWRILLMPLVVLKTTLQVGGKGGMTDLRRRVRIHGSLSIFFRGTVGTVVAQFMGHYPWFLVSNSLEELLANDLFGVSVTSVLIRAAFIGCVSSIVSDAITNSIKVVNTYRQTSDEQLSYGETIKRIVQNDGILSLFTRGLGAKMLVNCLNSIIFKVLLKLW
jgi:hypothetical protein